MRARGWCSRSRSPSSTTNTRGSHVRWVFRTHGTTGSARRSIETSVRRPQPISQRRDLADPQTITDFVADLAAACEDPLGPTHLLLRRAAPGVPGQIWRSPVMVDDVPERDVNPVFLDDGFILYACDDIAG